MTIPPPIIHKGNLPNAAVKVLSLLLAKLSGEYKQRTDLSRESISDRHKYRGRYWDPESNNILGRGYNIEKKVKMGLGVAMQH